MRIPPLPAEIVHHILELATSDPNEAERLPTPPDVSTNAFLSTASLVSRTWRSSAQSLLLRKGLVRLASIDPFMEQIEKRGIRPSSIRFGAGNPTISTPGGEASDEPDWVVEALFRVLETFESLREIECVGSGFDLLGHDVILDWQWCASISCAQKGWSGT